jgi:putative flippase GtrA
MVKKQLVRFGIIGLIALGVHLSSVMILVNLLGIVPLIANIIGFLIAFQISYWGHYKWTFEANHVSHKTAFVRLFTMASCNFILNESLYAGLLYKTKLPYDLALFIVLVFISALTFIISKFWVFR